jgi:hypothetical protein
VRLSLFQRKNGTMGKRRVYRHLTHDSQKFKEPNLLHNCGSQTYQITRQRTYLEPFVLLLVLSKKPITYLKIFKSLKQEVQTSPAMMCVCVCVCVCVRDLQKYFSHSSLVSVIFFSNPTHKTETRTPSRWETMYRITWTNHYDWPIRNKEHQSYHIYYTLLWSGVRLCYAFLQTLQKCWAKTSLLSQTGMFWLSFIQFLFVESHTKHRWSCSQYKTRKH